MDVFDKIFTKTNTDENKKKSKMVLGKLLIKLRSNNHIKLYSLMESVSDTNIENGVFKITIDDAVSYDMISNQKDISTIQELLGQIEQGLSLELLSTGRRVFDPIKFESYLRQEFGKILVVK